MVNWWFGSRRFGIRIGVPLRIPITFIRGSLEFKLPAETTTLPLAEIRGYWNIEQTFLDFGLKNHVARKTCSKNHFEWIKIWHIPVALVTSFCFLSNSTFTWVNARSQGPNSMILFQPTEGRAVSLLEGIMNDIYTKKYSLPLYITSCWDIWTLTKPKNADWLIVHIHPPSALYIDGTWVYLVLFCLFDRLSLLGGLVPSTHRHPKELVKQ